MAALAPPSARRSSEPATPVSGTPNELRTWSKVNWLISIPFFLVHIAAFVGCWWVGFSWKGVALALGFYYLRMFFVTAGYHRYFAHRAFRTGRFFQFILALGCITTTQKGVLWWASHHRHHHQFSDTEQDVHSLRHKGFWWSHVLWILSDDYSETDLEKIKDFARYPELRFFDRYHMLMVVVFAAGIQLAFGWEGLFYGYFLSTVLLWHGTFTINSLAHWMGRRRFETTDDSRNSAVLALVTMGEGWHNNHHFYQRSVNQGFYWWEIDLTYYILRALSWLGVVWDLHTPPKGVLARARRHGESDEAFQARLQALKAEVRKRRGEPTSPLLVDPAPAAE